MVTTTENALGPAQCLQLIEAAGPLLQPRGANRSDHLPLTLDDYPLTADLAEVITTLLDGLHRHHAKLLRYRAGHAHPLHTDYFGNLVPHRTLSVQLSDPATYRGGILHIDGTPTPATQGCAVTFPSTTPHHVTRLDHGQRWTLTAWAYR